MTQKLDDIDVRKIFFLIFQRRYRLAVFGIIYIFAVNIFSQAIPEIHRLEIHIQSRSPGWTNSNAYDIAIQSDAFLKKMDAIHEKNLANILYIKSRASVFIDTRHPESIDLGRLNSDVESDIQKKFEEELEVYKRHIEANSLLASEGNYNAALEVRSLELEFGRLLGTSKPVYVSHRWIPSEVHRSVYVNGLAISSLFLIIFLYAYFANLISVVQKVRE